MKLLAEAVIGSLCVFSEPEDFSMVVAGEPLVATDLITELTAIESDYLRAFEADSVGTVRWQQIRELYLSEQIAENRAQRDAERAIRRGDFRLLVISRGWEKSLPGLRCEPGHQTVFHVRHPKALGVVTEAGADTARDSADRHAQQYAETYNRLVWAADAAPFPTCRPSDDPQEDTRLTPQGCVAQMTWPPF